MKQLFILFSVLTVALFSSCSKNEDPDPDDLLHSYYCGDYTVGSDVFILRAKLNGVAVTSASAKVDFHSSDMLKGTFKIYGILNGGKEVVFTDVPFFRGEENGYSFELKNAAGKKVGEGIITGGGFGVTDKHYMDLNLTEE